MENFLIYLNDIDGVTGLKVLRKSRGRLMTQVS